MRWIIGLLAVLCLVSLASGLVLLTTDSAPDSVNLAGRALNAQLFSLGLVFLAVVLERMAVVLGFVDSRRAGRSGWSLVLVSLCLLVALDSLFFAMRLKGLLPERWLLLQLPPEEVTPPLEALLLALTALAYALCTSRGKGAKRSSVSEPQPTIAPAITAPAPLGPPLPPLGEAST